LPHTIYTFLFVNTIRPGLSICATIKRAIFGFLVDVLSRIFSVLRLYMDCTQRIPARTYSEGGKAGRGATHWSPHLFATSKHQCPDIVTSPAWQNDARTCWL